ncbi:helix-turn-helix domain-containing protein [Eubacteriales bacterium OttesenSCG-928-G02]|nr:helix-turn-helix domain-containing protein [Eubacteriales bacterium OttesenSCG-928-G02]
MNSMNSNISNNLRHLRSSHGLSQEQVAEKIGVTRQAFAKWENGETLPDIINCEALAEFFDVSLNDLVRHNPKEAGMPIAPKNKHIFGTVTVGERGQIVLPKKARDTMSVQAGDVLVVLGDTNPITPGIALIKSDVFLRMTGQPIDILN